MIFVIFIFLKLRYNLNEIKKSPPRSLQASRLLARPGPQTCLPVYLPEAGRHSLLANARISRFTILFFE
jgi:hypothetical protein